MQTPRLRPSHACWRMSAAWTESAAASSASFTSSLRAAALQLAALWHSAPPPARVALSVMAAASSVALLRSSMVQRSASRLSHRCFTHVTNSMLALTTTRWTQGWVRPNPLDATTQQLDHPRATHSESTPLLQVTAHSADAAALSFHSAFAAGSSSSASSSASVPPIRDVLVTVHGYLGLPRPFFLFRAPFVNAGFHVDDYSYSSGGSMDDIAQGLCERIERTSRELWRRETEAAAAQGRPVQCSPLRFSFACHSMGGLVLRTAISSGRFPIPMPDSASTSPAVATGSASSPQPQPQPLLSMGRIVMIATPNGGSAYARRINQWPRIKSIVLSFARLTSMRSRQRAAAADSASSTSAAASSRLASSPVSSAPLPDVLACGDLLMSHPPSWFHRNLLLPRSLYPRTLVIAGTMALTDAILPAPSDGTVRLEETYLPQPRDDDGTGEANGRSETHEAASSSNGTGVDVAASSTSAAAPRPSSSSRFVSAGPAGSSHMSFYALHSILVAHPGVIAASLRYIQTGNAEPEKPRSEWD